MDNLNPFEPIEESQKIRSKVIYICQRKFVIAAALLLFVEIPQVICAWITLAEKYYYLRHQYSSVIQWIDQRGKENK